MKSPNDMSAVELRIAIVTEGPNPWLNVRRDRKGRLVGDVPIGLSECPDIVPNWPFDIDEAIKLEDTFIGSAMQDEYIRNLIKVIKADTASNAGLYLLAHATARQRSEAALLTLRSAATYQTV